MAAWQKTYPIQKIKILKSHLIDASDDDRMEALKEVQLTSMIARASGSEDLAKLLMAAFKFKVALDRLKQIIDEDLG